MPCPFLTRLPSTFVKNYASPLVKQYMDQCPFLGTKRGIVSSVIKDDNVGKAKISFNNVECPFLKEAKSPELIKQVEPRINEDIIEGK